MRKLVYGTSTVIVLSSTVLLTSFGASESSYSSQPRSPYTSQKNSPVQGLSSQEVDDLINGRGAGYARTAELNSYPGPRHVLDLKQELNLSPTQVQKVEAIFQQMDAEAKPLGRKIVEREKQLSRAFAARKISAFEIQTQTQHLALLYGQYRAVHLQPHLEVSQLLSAAQVAKYNQLRGYSSAESSPEPRQHH